MGQNNDTLVAALKLIMDGNLGGARIILGDKIKVEGHVGTWHIIDTTIWKNKYVHLLEHDKYGDDAASIIVDNDLKIVLDEAWNGFSDLDDIEDEEQIIRWAIGETG